MEGCRRIGTTSVDDSVMEEDRFTRAPSAGRGLSGLVVGLALLMEYDRARWAAKEGGVGSVIFIPGTEGARGGVLGAETVGDPGGEGVGTSEASGLDWEEGVIGVDILRDALWISFWSERWDRGLT